MSSKLFDVIDFEASSLGAMSYPIEVGWTNGSEVHSILIKPIPEWTDWNDYAEKEVHHITREMLEEHGVSPYEALSQLNANFGAGILWCDGGHYDAWWLQRLEEAAGFKASFRLGDIFHMLQTYHGVSGDQFVSSKTQVILGDKLSEKTQVDESQQPHRAGYDAVMIKKALYNAIGYY